MLQHHVEMDEQKNWRMDSWRYDEYNVPESVSLRYTVPLDLDSSRYQFVNDERRWSMSKVERPKSNTSFTTRIGGREWPCVLSQLHLIHGWKLGNGVRQMGFDNNTTSGDTIYLGSPTRLRGERKSRFVLQHAMNGTGNDELTQLSPAGSGFKQSILISITDRAHVKIFQKKENKRW